MRETVDSVSLDITSPFVLKAVERMHPMPARNLKHDTNPASTVRDIISRGYRIKVMI